MTTTHQHPLDVSLPYDIAPRADAASRDVKLRLAVSSATQSKDDGRKNACREAFGEHYDAVRKHAGAIKQYTLDHLDFYLEQFADRAEANGTKVHYAATAAETNDLILKIARDRKCKLCVKSKSMVTEETHLLPALEAAGVETVETDLGEFIIQLDHDAPSHIVTPMIHKDRAAVGRAFERELGVAYTDDPETLTMIARAHLRAKYRAADLGISGSNFLVAETGTLVLCTNEGNGRFCTGAPRTHIAVVGIEKLVPRLTDLSILLKLLARSGTSQPLTVYTSFITGPRRPLEPDGPEEVHVILVDNGRTEILRAETRELLRCIRCGACLNACPVYRSIGGHAYGGVYSGPIGATITPLLKGLHNYPDLPQASSLCGACFEACPVHIDIPRQLVNLRRELNRTHANSLAERLAYRAWAFAILHPTFFRFAARAQRWLLSSLADTRAADSLTPSGWLSESPLPVGGPLCAWTQARDFPAPAQSSFREWWNSQ